MCSFLYTSKPLLDKEIEISNKLLKLRGPDNTNILKGDFGTLIHNRLQIEGDCIQPYRDKDIILAFNGEIYNYIQNEAEFIINCYKKYGDKFATYLDGEFAILLIDIALQKVFVAVDIFKTKPLWISTNEGIHVASYKSALIDIKCENIVPAIPNTTLIYNIKTTKHDSVSVTTFDLKQHKDSYTDFQIAFNNAIIKRTRTDAKIFIGLSSGYDSGCIAAKLLQINKAFSSYTVNNKENKTVLALRRKLINSCEDINYSGSHNVLASLFLKKYCELPEHTEYNYQKDISCKPLMYLGYRAKLNKCKVFLSGTGSDEIYGDYFITKNYENDSSSCFKGKYPKDLNKIFPWNNFFNGTMRKYLTKDEYIIGSLGIETRYPFLDKALVQEFLWLNHTLKNAGYKAPLQQFLEEVKFPYCKDEKLGFNV